LEAKTKSALSCCATEWLLPPQQHKAWRTKQFLPTPKKIVHCNDPILRFYLFNFFIYYLIVGVLYLLGFR